MLARGTGGSAGMTGLLTAYLALRGLAGEQHALGGTPLLIRSLHKSKAACTSGMALLPLKNAGHAATVTQRNQFTSHAYESKVHRLCH